jgi:glycosyltransferase involved in cell wall biosynthesis
MKICYLVNNINPKNGWGRYASDLICGVRKKGHEAIILKEMDDGLEGEAVLKRGIGMFLSAIKIREHLKECDIIHALDVYPYGIIAYLANLFLGKKMIITAQGTYSIAPFYNIKTRYLAKLTCNSADILIAISHYTKDEFLKELRVNKIEVINHGIDLDKFYKDREVSNENYILSVGALKFRKGYHISIPAFAEVKKRIPDLKYKIVGDQSDRNYFEKLKKLVKEYGVEQAVEFLSNLSDYELGKLYSQAKLFILTSVNEGHHFEGFGLVFLEAAAAGLPVIGTINNGIEDAVDAGSNGFLVSQGNIGETAKAIIKILSDSEKYSKFSQNSYKWAQDHNLENVTDRYIEKYFGVLTTK